MSWVNCYIPAVNDMNLVVGCEVATGIPHLSTSCWLSFISFLCSTVLSPCRTELVAGGLLTLCCWDSTGAGREVLMLGFWETAVEELVFPLPLLAFGPSSFSLVVIGNPPKKEPEPRRSRILKMSSDNVPLFSSTLSWMRLHRLRASALAAIPERGQLNVGKVWVRLRGLSSQLSVERGVDGELQFPLPGAGLSLSSSSSGDSDRDASPIWDNTKLNINYRRYTQKYIQCMCFVINYTIDITKSAVFGAWNYFGLMKLSSHYPANNPL